MAQALRRLTKHGIGLSRFRFRAVARAVDVPYGCPPTHHDCAACERTEAV